jgi:pyruvate dehydrogenase E1 component beta subunit
MAVLQIREAIRDAMREEMLRDDRVFLMGEEVGHYEGAYKCSQGLLKEFGEKRVIDTPITETGFAGVGIGAAMCGLRPIIEFMTFNFSAVAFDQIINNAAKIHHMTGGQFHAPMVFRGPNAAAHMLGSTHSQAFDTFYAHIPGLKVVSVATPKDAKGLLKAAIRDPNPVIFFESEVQYGVKGEVPEEEYLIELGVADIKREGADVTLLCWGQSVAIALSAAELAQEKGLDVEVIDLRSLRPLDEQAIFDSVRKTNRAVVVEHGWPYGGVGSHLIARIQEECFDALDAPVLKVCYEDLPMSYAENLEHLTIPQPSQVLEALEEVSYRG